MSVEDTAVQNELFDSVFNDLSGRYGSVMSPADLAAALGVTASALRSIRSREGVAALPPKSRLPGRGGRWLTREVAQWLADCSNVPTAEAPRRGRRRIVAGGAA